MYIHVYFSIDFRYGHIDVVMQRIINRYYIYFVGHGVNKICHWAKIGVGFYVYIVVYLVLTRLTYQTSTMKKTLLLLVITASFACCRKRDEVVNNYTTVGSAQPAFAINGINDVSFINDENYGEQLSLTVQYLDSAQENVTLGVTGLPAGIVYDTTWINSGIPTFSTILSFFDTGACAAPGIYPVRLTATTTSGKTRSYPFNIKVQGMPTEFLGKYNTCSYYCSSASGYSDSIFADATVRNKVWFSNFGNTGNQIYALITPAQTMTIPSQTVGGVTYSSTATTIQLSNHMISIQVHAGSSLCNLTMR